MGVLDLTGAVACAVCRGILGKLPGNAGQLSAVFLFGQVETADEDIRTEVVDDIQDPLMGAAAEEDPFASLDHQHILLMAEVLGNTNSAAQCFQSPGF